MDTITRMITATAIIMVTGMIILTDSIPSDGI
jgi:hypothetical protein